MQRTFLTTLVLLALVGCGSDSTARGALTSSAPACDSSNLCEGGAQCYSVTQVTGQPDDYACIEGNPCTSIQCDVGTCAIDDIAPPAVVCVEGG